MCTSDLFAHIQHIWQMDAVLLKQKSTVRSLPLLCPGNLASSGDRAARRRKPNLHTDLDVSSEFPELFIPLQTLRCTLYRNTKPRMMSGEIYCTFVQRLTFRDLLCLSPSPCLLLLSLSLTLPFNVFALCEENIAARKKKRKHFKFIPLNCKNNFNVHHC